ncbi:adenosine deaminase [bacterium]|nr:adenosine deaminase [candidate division CSSED10-310 bacterium]
MTFQNDSDSLANLIQKVPKTELHIHLEGSIPHTVMLDLIKRVKDGEVIHSVSELKKRFRFKSVQEFLKCWQWKNRFITLASDFRTIAYKVLEDLHCQNVKYAELFCSPGDFKNQDLSMEAIIENVILGIKAAEMDFGICSTLIVDLVRDDGPVSAMKKLKKLQPFLNNGVIGIGLGGSEREYPPGLFKDVFHKAKSMGFYTTVHAGEGTPSEFIWEALRTLEPDRIGHAFSAFQDPILVRYLCRQRIPVELCPTSNVRTQLCPDLKSHPLKQYLDNELLVTVNTDDPSMFQITLIEEYMNIVRHMDLSLNDIYTLSMNGVRASFLAESDKLALLNRFETEWDELRCEAP